MVKHAFKKYDLNAKEVGNIEIEYDDSEAPNSQSVKDYIVALRANARQWSANTKTRSENNHSGAKPHAQKGTGKARQGFLGAPQYRGGGRVHAPKPKFDQHVRINKKEKRAAIRGLLIDRIKEGQIIVLDSNVHPHFEKPKTKVIKHFLAHLGWGNQKVLCLVPSEMMSTLDNFKLSMRNLSKVFVLPIENINGYDVLVNQKFIVMESALDGLNKLVRG